MKNILNLVFILLLSGCDIGGITEPLEDVPYLRVEEETTEEFSNRLIAGVYSTGVFLNDRKENYLVAAGSEYDKKRLEIWKADLEELVAETDFDLTRGYATDLDYIELQISAQANKHFAFSDGEKVKALRLNSGKLERNTIEVGAKVSKLAVAEEYIYVVAGGHLRIFNSDYGLEVSYPTEKGEILVRFEDQTYLVGEEKLRYIQGSKLVDVSIPVGCDGFEKGELFYIVSPIVCGEVEYSLSSAEYNQSVIFAAHEESQEVFATCDFDQDSIRLESNQPEYFNILRIVDSEGAERFRVEVEGKALTCLPFVDGSANLLIATFADELQERDPVSIDENYFLYSVEQELFVEIDDELLSDSRIPVQLKNVSLNPKLTFDITGLLADSNSTLTTYSYK